MVGFNPIKKVFEKLVKEKNLSHGYIFFGDPQIGKRTFAEMLANRLEKGKFEIPSSPLSEFFVVKPTQIEEGGEWSIKIDDARDLKSFLYKKPVNSAYRVAVIDDAHLLTGEAEDALLKIAEEPPAHSLIIMVVANPEALSKTLRSRFQKVYFPRATTTEIKKMLVEEFKLGLAEAEKIAGLSFGRPGRAIDLVKNERLAEINREATDFLRGKTSVKDVVAHLGDAENRDKINDFLSALIAQLSLDPQKNITGLRSLVRGFSRLNEWNSNRKLQLSAALRGIANE